MYTIDASRQKPVSNIVTMHSYLFPQFCCITNIKTFGYGLYLQRLVQKSFFYLDFLIILLLLSLSFCYLGQEFFYSLC